MKIYIYEDKETADKIARITQKLWGISVEQKGTALKMEESLYVRLTHGTYTPKAKELKVGTIVMWNNDPDVLGVVIEFNLAHGVGGFCVEWKGGPTGWVDFQDAWKVSIVK